VLSQDKDYFANLAVDAVLRLRVRVYLIYFNFPADMMNTGIDRPGAYPNYQKGGGKAH
jgi:hypothetical protein